MYFDDCQKPEELYEAIKKIRKNPPASMFPHMRGNTRIGPDGHNNFCENPSQPLNWSGVYIEARDCALRLYTSIPNLPKLPNTESDASIGLQSIMEWCIDAQKPNSKNRKIFGDKFKLWGLSINYKNLWHKIKNWLCVARGIKKIRKFFRR